MKTITVREYARLTTDYVKSPSLDRVQISPETFKELCALNNQKPTGHAQLIRVCNEKILTVCNYVGILQIPQGICIEILPKTGADNSLEAIVHERKLLIKMLNVVTNLPFQKNEAANISCFASPLQEWIIHRFLKELHKLYQKGICLKYNYIAEERPFLRGRLDIGKQIVQPPQRMHRLHIRHMLFSPDRAEHRLLRSALDRCLAVTREYTNIRLGMPLRLLFADIRPSYNLAADFQQWDFARHMAHYQAIRPWCELVLGQNMPFALKGDWRGISMLFPMEKLFEQYVCICLRRQLVSGATLSAQVSHRHLCTLEDIPRFILRPDISILFNHYHWLLDTKWKRLSLEKINWGISPQDMYQLFAYGHQYLNGKGDIALIYPAHSNCPTISAPFRFSDSLNLWVLTYDLDRDILQIPSGCPLKQAFM